MRQELLVLATALMLLERSTAWGEAPRTITYQGYRRIPQISQ
jgi:hypothetical protein